MQPPTHTALDYKALVARGYDDCAARFLATSEQHPLLVARRS